MNAIEIDPTKLKTVYLGEVSAADHHQPISDDDESNQQFMCDGDGEGGCNDNGAIPAVGGSGSFCNITADGSDENNVVMQDSVVG